MSNLPTYHGMPALTPRKPAMSMRDQVKDIIDENLSYDYDGSVSGFEDAADAILAVFTVTERK